MLSLLGRDIPTAVVMTVAVALLWRRQRRTAAAWLAMSALIGFLGHTLLKALIGRPRPDWPDALTSASTAAMPSGHAASGIDAWVVLGVILLVGATGGRRALALGVIAAGILMGPSRLLLGVHWPTDVLAGWLFGAAVACAAAAAMLWWAARPVRD